jgi:cytochrome b
LKEIRVWDLQTRVFHWSLLVFLLCTFVTTDMPRLIGLKTLNKDAWLAFHIGTGVAVGMLLAFRFFWGFFGPYYSRFGSLHLSPKELFRYLECVWKNVRTSYTAHNPGASWELVCVIVLGMLAVITGFVVLGLDERRGLLRFLYTAYYPYAPFMKGLHLGISYLLLMVAIAHIAGVLLETVRHRTGIITAMFTGRKLSGEPEPSPTASRFLSAISFAWVSSPILAALFFATTMETPKPTTLTIPQAYKKECGSCHMAFPPNALPAGSWQAMMADLSDHFGDDASIGEPERIAIEDFLVRNSAEHSLEEASIKFLRSIGNDKPPLRITTIGYWIKKHDAIRQEIYRRETIRSKSNCVACHKWAEYGSFEDSDIKIPRQ